jgi:peptidoglycan-N-acetylglucosamine deacetylase
MRYLSYTEMRSAIRALPIWATALMATIAVAPAQEIAFTWDDLPSHNSLPPGETRVNIASQIISAMKAANLPPVYGFMNAAKTEREPLAIPVLQEWRDAGLPLANHTWSHMNLNESSLADWETDVLKNEAPLESYMKNNDWHWFRYPFLAEGETPEKRNAARAFLAQHGYKIAAVTMDFDDWAYNEPYSRCVAKGDTAAVDQLTASYLAAAEAGIAHARAMSKQLYGRDIPYVLLMHVGALDARMLPQLLKLYRERGFRFIRLEDAEKDPFYKNDLDLSLPAVPDMLEEAMHQRNLPIAAMPQPTVDLNAVCR